jgi:hypothetical protein
VGGHGEASLTSGWGPCHPGIDGGRGHHAVEVTVPTQWAEQAEGLLPYSAGCAAHFPLPSDRLRAESVSSLGDRD